MTIGSSDFDCRGRYRMPSEISARLRRLASALCDAHRHQTFDGETDVRECCRLATAGLLGKHAYKRATVLMLGRFAS